MKLLFCPHCNDVKKLDRGMVYCSCRNSFGQYLNDGLHAEVGGLGRVIGIANSDIAEAVVRPDHSTIRCWLFGDSPHLRYIKGG